MGKREEQKEVNREVMKNAMERKNLDQNKTDFQIIKSKKQLREERKIREYIFRSLYLLFFRFQHCLNIMIKIISNGLKPIYVEILNSLLE